MFKSALGRLRLIGWVEGISFLVLLGIAMPLKYLANIPEAVLVVGWAHGVLYMLYLVAVADVTIRHRWSIWRIFLAFVASILPFGTFVFDRSLREEQQNSQQPSVPDVATQ